jgi:hypothetical protein
MVERSTVDYHQSELIRLERLKAQVVALQIRHLTYLDEAQVATADGSRSLAEWVAARLDVSPETAKTLVRTMRRIADRPDLSVVMADGEVTFDRVEALSRIPEEAGLLEHLDVAGVRREAARRVRITAEDEARTAEDRFSRDPTFARRILVEGVGWPRRSLWSLGRQSPQRGCRPPSRDARRQPG